MFDIFGILVIRDFEGLKCLVEWCKIDLLVEVLYDFVELWNGFE